MPEQNETDIKVDFLDVPLEPVDNIIGDIELELELALDLSDYGRAHLREEIYA